MNSERLRTVAVWLIALVAIFVALKLAQSIFAPLTLALVIGVVLSPLSDALERLGVPALIGAILTLCFGLAMLTLLYVLLEPVAQQLIERAPMIWRELRDTVMWLSQVVRGLDEVSKDVADAVTSAPSAPKDSGELAEDLPSLSDALFLAPQLAGNLLVFVGSLFFFVLSRNEIYSWANRLLLQADIPVERCALHRAERVVAHYFLTITVINAGLGVIVTGMMMFLDMPSPVLLGVLAFLLNFILYLGPLAFAVGLLVSGMVVFDGTASFVPMLIFIGLNTLEGQFVTPALVGRHLRINALLVFLSLVFWLWLWGPIGGFVAIPLLIWGIALVEGLRENQEVAGV